MTQSATNHKEKNKILGIRIDEETFDNFDQFCKERHLSKSEVARKAIMRYVHVIYNPERNAKLLFSKSQFKYCLSCLSSNQLEELARISVQNGQKDMEMLRSIVSPSQKGNPDQNDLDFQIKTLLRFVFSPDGQNWFDEVSYTWQEKTLIFKGLHTLGLPFSLYISDLLSRYASQVNYRLTFDAFSRSFQNTKEVFSLEIHFSPQIL